VTAGEGRLTHGVTMGDSEAGEGMETTTGSVVGAGVTSATGAGRAVVSTTAGGADIAGGWDDFGVSTAAGSGRDVLSTDGAGPTILTGVGMIGELLAGAKT
jgi:hypothetical protein